MRSLELLVIIFLFSCSTMVAQHSPHFHFTNDSMAVTGFSAGKNMIPFSTKLPLVSYLVGSKSFTSLAPSSQVRIRLAFVTGNPEFIRGTVQFENVSTDTIRIHNVVPMGIDSSHVYITGLGEHDLSRTHLFRPGKAPVNIIVPDNAGFTLSNALLYEVILRDGSVMMIG